jgi:hypothetical protein
MTDKQLELFAENAALRIGCIRALKLLTNPDATEFDADRLIKYLEIVLGDTV